MSERSAARSIELHGVAPTPAESGPALRGSSGFVFSKNPGLRVTRVCCRQAARMMDLLSRQRVSACRVGGGGGGPEARIPRAVGQEFVVLLRLALGRSGAGT